MFGNSPVGGVYAIGPLANPNAAMGGAIAASATLTGGQAFSYWSSVPGGMAVPYGQWTWDGGSEDLNAQTNMGGVWGAASNGDLVGAASLGGASYFNGGGVPGNLHAFVEQYPGTWLGDANSGLDGNGDDGAIDLNALIDNTGWVLEGARAVVIAGNIPDANDVNHSGEDWIVGWGTYDGVEHGFLLTPSVYTPVPTPEPSTLLLVATGLLGLLAYAWRKRK
jgi:hypothetical protein